VQDAMNQCPRCGEPLNSGGSCPCGSLFDNLARYPVTLVPPAPCPDCLALAKVLLEQHDINNRHTGKHPWYEGGVGQNRKLVDALADFIAERER